MALVTKEEQECHPAQLASPLAVNIAITIPAQAKQLPWAIQMGQQQGMQQKGPWHQGTQKG